jgi:hypothetical protein
VFTNSGTTKEKEEINMKDRIMKMDGKREHMSEDFVGKRYSIVCYTPANFKGCLAKIPEKEELLKDLGFNLPGEEPEEAYSEKDIVPFILHDHSSSARGSNDPPAGVPMTMDRQVVSSEEAMFLCSLVFLKGCNLASCVQWFK